jgi:hypothetical protein
MEDGPPNQQSHATNHYGPDQPAQADIDEMLRRKRKAREYKAGNAAWCRNNRSC